jgi:peptidase E
VPAARTRSEGQIILVGGGGWYYRGSADRATDDEVLRHTGGGRTPRICLVAAAQGDDGRQHEQFIHHMGDRGMLSSAPLFSLLPGAGDPRERLLAADLIYLIGGNTGVLGAALREVGWLPVLRAALRRGATVAGVCAGALVLCEAMVFRWANGLGDPRAAPGLGLVRGSLSCHADLLPAQTAVHEAAIAAGDAPAGWALDDGAMLRLTARGRLLEAVRSRPGATAAHLSARDGRIVRRELDLRLLPGAA